EIKELCENCNWTWVTKKEATGNDVNGYSIVGKNGNSIFLPAAGFREGTELERAGEYGDYWSSSLNVSRPGNACDLYFFSGDVDRSYFWRYEGHSVRAVTK
ncbi:MAG: hypothetical protein HUJ94_05050, partial [Bacteroidales bacterium]|nr:hypothetical protein [Bacteroidales bacterium]